MTDDIFQKWKNEYKEIVKMHCHMETPRLKKYLSNYLKDDPDYTVTEGDKWIFGQGNNEEFPVLLVAHMDTVFDSKYLACNYASKDDKTIPPLAEDIFWKKHIYYDEIEGVMWSPEGLGADDRAGTAAIQFLIEHNYKPSVLFTDEEEIGGLGALDFLENYNYGPEPYRFILELDRQGKKDICGYNCENEDFLNWLSHYGYNIEKGTFSDIVHIAEQWDTAAANLSIGYYNEHSRLEYLNLNQSMRSIIRVTQILQDSAMILPQYFYRNRIIDFYKNL